MDSGFPADSLRGFPAGAVTALRAHWEHPSREGLDRAVRAMLEFYLPAGARGSLAEVPGSVRLKEDLGVDSLALAEAVFKWDDVFGTSIETREAAGVGTLDELVGFLADRTGLTGVDSSRA